MKVLECLLVSRGGTLCRSGQWIVAPFRESTMFREDRPLWGQFKSLTRFERGIRQLRIKSYFIAQHLKCLLAYRLVIIS